MQILNAHKSYFHQAFIDTCKVTFLELLPRKFCTAPKSFKMYDLMFIGLVSARSCEIGVVGYNWLVGWLVTQFSQKSIFLIFCMKLGDYKGRKVTERAF